MFTPLFALALLSNGEFVKDTPTPHKTQEAYEQALREYEEKAPALREKNRDSHKKIQEHRELQDANRDGRNLLPRGNPYRVETYSLEQQIEFDSLNRQIGEAASGLAELGRAVQDAKPEEPKKEADEPKQLSNVLKELKDWNPKSAMVMRKSGSMKKARPISCKKARKVADPLETDSKTLDQAVELLQRYPESGHISDQGARDAAAYVDFIQSLRNPQPPMQAEKLQPLEGEIFHKLDRKFLDLDLPKTHLKLERHSALESIQIMERSELRNLDLLRSIQNPKIRKLLDRYQLDRKMIEDLETK